MDDVDGGNCPQCREESMELHDDGRYRCSNPHCGTDYFFPKNEGDVQ